MEVMLSGITMLSRPLYAKVSFRMEVMLEESFAVFRFWQWLNAAVATLVTLFGSSRLVRPE